MYWLVVSNNFLFSPLVVEDSHFDSYFSSGLKPPTRCIIELLNRNPFLVVVGELNNQLVHANENRKFWWLKLLKFASKFSKMFQKLPGIFLK